MRQPRSRASYDEPFGWWGPVWAPPAARSVADLVAGGTLGAPLAGLFWALLARRASVVVVAGPSGAGKTTLLTALLDFLPPGTRRLYARGAYEPFDFLGDPAVDPGRSVLLANEVSPHLPIYLWGPGVRRFLGARRAGFALGATAHATDAAGFVAGLAGYPLRVPAEEIAGFDLVVALDAWRGQDGAVRRAVATVDSLAPVAAGGLALETLAGRARRGEIARPDVGAAGPLVRRLGDDPAGLAAEVAERAAVLVSLADGAPPGDVAAAIAAAAGRWAAAGAVD